MSLTRVVLVGNGPSARERKLGGVIDAHQTVVRFNRFHIAGHEDYVGTKTSIWAFGTPLMRIENGRADTERFLLEDRTAGKRMCVLHWKPCEKSHWGKHHGAAIRAGFEYLPEDVAKETWNFFKNVQPSTGALMFGFYGFKGINMAAIGFDHFTGEKLHYGDRMKGRPEIHCSDLERKWAERWIERGLLEWL